MERLHNYRVWEIALTLSSLFVVASILYYNYLFLRLAETETKQMEIWAEATRQLVNADEGTDIDFVSSIIEGNTTIPVYMLDAEGNVLLTRNVTRPVKDPTQLHGPIVVTIDGNASQLIYYDDSLALQRLQHLPLISFGVLAVLLLIGLIILYMTQRSEQNRVWVGLSKETAHQLGTPISSLAAWEQLLRERYPDDELIPQMQQDIHRLQAVAERFSKVGSEAELTRQLLFPLVEDTIVYMQSRVSKKVVIHCFCNDEDKTLQADLNAPLFQWVLENLIKNAVDAMSGAGTITLRVHRSNRTIFIDVADTGKGMERKLFKRIFRPGFTTKQRGWGLGLSLSKRIIEDYHRGKLFVQESTVGQGSVFRITLKDTVDNAPAT
ncbi:MAG: ATP-binding protein [Paludibacteraceae bacterium]|nr:ATP-binding protein [Paludibacteraceae bacterium]